MPHIEEAVLHAYLDGARAPADAARIDAHVTDCELCRARLEEVREVRERASELLASLEPGPIHAPAFAELEARAARRGGSVAVIGSPWWRQPSLAWAASLALAFGLGWLVRAELGAPAGVFSGPAASLDGLASTANGARAPERDALEGAEEKAPASAANDAGRPDAAGAAVEPTDPAGRRNELAAAVAPPGAAGAPTTANVAPPSAVGPPATVAVPDPSEPVVTLGARAEQTEAERADLQAVVGAMTFATTGGAGTYLLVSGTDVERWLGAPPRRLPELTLLRAEVGPPPASPVGPTGSPIVRLVYLSENGQEITLTQQLAAGADAARADAPADADARVGAEARRRVLADREAPALFEAFADDLPATFVEPDGTVTYRWRDADGYLLALSGSVDADVLRALADRVR